MTVAEIDALLYLPGPPAPAAAARAADPRAQPRLAGLVPGAARRRGRRGNAGLARRRPAARMGRVPRRCASPRSSARADDRDLHPPRGPGRRGARRRRAPASTSRSGCSPRRPARCSAATRSPPPGDGRYRISVKREPTAPRAATCTPARASATALDVAAPRGDFVLDRSARARAAVSAGIGATPVLAMLHALAARAHRARGLVAARRAQPRRPRLRRRGPRPARVLPHAHAPRLLQPARPGRPRGRRRRPAGRLAPRRSPSSAARATPRPTSAARRRSWRRSAPPWPRSGSTRRGSTPSCSGRRPARRPGIAGDARAAAAPARRRARAPGPPSPSPAAASPSPGARLASLLELAEACDVPSAGPAAPASATPARPPSIAGAVDYAPDPVEPPADGSA